MLKRLRMKIFLFIILLTASAFGQTFNGVVVSIVDADTLRVSHSDGNLDRVRILGIDAPEVAHSKQEISQPSGEACKNFLHLLVGTEVTIETTRRDNYGRVLGRVISDDSDIGLLLLKTGCAWIYYPLGLEKDVRAIYQAAYENARMNKIGLFSRSRYVTPTVWRRRKHLKRVKH